MEPKNEKFEFQAEVKQLLHILAYSLYTNKEIFIRELVSNASDALNKINYLLLTNEDKVYGAGSELCVRIEFDKSEKSIIVKDTGIGMTKSELIENIGTIAKSGTKTFIENMSKEGKNIEDIIGQFGVGFYSSFIVAKKIEVITKSYIKDEPAYKWSCDGSNSYTLEETEKKDRGTEVIVYLKDEEQEFLEKERVKNVIKKYSNFLRYPVYIENEKANEIEAIWTKQASQVKDEEYKEFYKFISHSSETPMFKIHKHSDAPIQFYMLIYCPEKNYNLFGMPEKDYGLSLYSNKVLIQEECKDLLPSYFRFIKGIVDSPDIPLNISRETIQNNSVVQKIKNVIIKSVINELDSMINTDRPKYEIFYKEFSRELKEGVNSDFSNREKLAALLLFNTLLAPDNKIITLKEYIESKKEGQKEIYFISGTDKKNIEKSPYLEIFKKKNVDVLFLTEPIDEIILSSLMKFEDMEFKSIDNSNLDFVKNIKSEDSDNQEQKLSKEEKNEFEDFLKFYRDTLGDKVITVIETDRLTDSPCCLVNPDNMSSHIQKILQMMNKDFKTSKKILQINPKNQLIKGLTKLYILNKESDLLKNICIQLFDSAQMIDGISGIEPADFTSRIMDIMKETVNMAVNAKQ
ncbi:molecular chaperone HtpG [Candidatus Dependentiae bacterium]|nr:molecular chaperone HtpG [Candidatus Dependentiae bacterium]